LHYLRLSPNAQLCASLQETAHLPPVLQTTSRPLKKEFCSSCFGIVQQLLPKQRRAIGAGRT